jgi:hypothetical protein
MTTKQQIKQARLAALISFLSGTMIFSLYFFTSYGGLLFIGYAFIAVTGIINLVILVSICIKAISDKVNRKKLLFTAVLMLLNIPVMLFYCWVGLILLNTLRITFSNPTQTTFTNIKILGGAGGQINRLATGESKIVWVAITGDGAINVEYLANGKKETESVAGYVTNGLGQKMKHNIGAQNKKKLFW